MEPMTALDSCGTCLRRSIVNFYGCTLGPGKSHECLSPNPGGEASQKPIVLRGLGGRPYRLWEPCPTPKAPTTFEPPMPADTTTKSTNPKDAIGSSKAPLSLLPLSFMAQVSTAFTNGKLKYGGVNWRAAGVRSSIYTDAALRHIMAWVEGEELDPDDNVHNLAAAGACLAILIDSLAQQNLNDDRPLQARDPRGSLNDAANTVASLRVLHKDKNPVNYTHKKEPNRCE